MLVFSKPNSQKLWSLEACALCSTNLLFNSFLCSLMLAAFLWKGMLEWDVIQRRAVWKWACYNTEIWLIPLCCHKKKHKREFVLTRSAGTACVYVASSRISWLKFFPVSRWRPFGVICIVISSEHQALSFSHLEIINKTTLLRFLQQIAEQMIFRKAGLGLTWP